MSRRHLGLALGLAAIALAAALVGAFGPAKRLHATYSWPPPQLPARDALAALVHAAPAPATHPGTPDCTDSLLERPDAAGGDEPARPAGDGPARGAGWRARGRSTGRPSRHGGRGTDGGPCSALQPRPVRLSARHPGRSLLARRRSESPSTSRDSRGHAGRERAPLRDRSPSEPRRPVGRGPYTDLRDRDRPPSDTRVDRRGALQPSRADARRGRSPPETVRRPTRARAWRVPPGPRRRRRGPRVADHLVDRRAGPLRRRLGPAANRDVRVGELAVDLLRRLRRRSPQRLLARVAPALARAGDGCSRPAQDSGTRVPLRDVGRRSLDRSPRARSLDRRGSSRPLDARSGLPGRCVVVGDDAAPGVRHGAARNRRPRLRGPFRRERNDRTAGVERRPRAPRDHRASRGHVVDRPPAGPVARSPSVGATRERPSPRRSAAPRPRCWSHSAPSVPTSPRRRSDAQQGERTLRRHELVGRAPALREPLPVGAT